MSEVQNTAELRRILGLPRRSLTDDYSSLAAEMTEVLRQPNGKQTLRSVQALALHDIGTCDGGFLPVGVGEGKTLVSLLAAYVLDAKKPILLLPASLIEKTHRERARAEEHWLVPNHIRLFSYDMLGRAQSAEELEIYKPDLIICDECFVTGTLIRTPQGLRPIEDIRAGDSVWAFDGASFSVQLVQDSWSRETDETYLLTVEQQTYETTGNHPFLTSEGWKRAADCKAGDDIVCDVREAFHVRCPEKEAALLRDELLCQVADGSAGDQGQVLQCGGVCKDLCSTPEGTAARSVQGIVREDDAKQSDEGSRDSGEGPGCACGRRASAEGARGQRASDVEAAGSASSGTGRVLGHREAHALEGVCYPGVLDRHLPRRCEDCSRGGRELTSISCGSGEGCAEDSIPRATRLARVTRVERRDRSGPGEGCRVYNLHVSGPHTYVLGSGLVVHNCHRLKNRRAAVTRRVSRWMHDHPETRFVGMSGTIMRKSLTDFAHILRWALKDKAPIPKTEQEIEEWASALDEPNPGVPGAELTQLEPGALAELCPDVPPTVENVRRGFRSRLVETPGVVATAGEAERVDCSLYIRAHILKVKPITEQHFATLRGAWQRPDGKEFEQGVEVWACARQLALGFHYEWAPPPPDPWMAARKAWSKYVRAILANSRTLDSPLEVINAIDAGRVHDEGNVLAKWRAVRDTFKPITVPVWHDTSALEFCADWAKKPGIIWAEHHHFATRLAKVTGLPYFGESGFSRDGTYVEDADCSKAIIASIRANKDGKNLQGDPDRCWKGFSRNLVVSPPEGWDVWQQAIARTHRPKQTADEVEVDILWSCREHVNAWHKAWAGTIAARDTVGSDEALPKLFLADVTLPADAEMSKLSGPRWRNM